MTFGVVMLVHTDLDRAEQVIRKWAHGGCPMVVHVDINVSDAAYQKFTQALDDIDKLKFSPRHRCEWGTWQIVEATQKAVQTALKHFHDISHIYLASGACLPLRPVTDLQNYLQKHPTTDFIESVTTADVPWTMGGLDKERFILRFPFSWKKRRVLFDRYVKLQLALGFRRKIPDGITPHMGSQWWCLTRKTLEKIHNDPDRATFDKYFSKVWIPDESYFQTLARRHSKIIESRSLTLSKFDHQGKPHIFYDDHIALLRRSDCFVARKIWAGASGLYDHFPKTDEPSHNAADATKIDRIFTHASERRLNGRAGLIMHSRFPHIHNQKAVTARPYSIFQGMADICPDFQNHLSTHYDVDVHGHLFAKDRAHFSDGAKIIRGGQCDNAKLRDYNPSGFLTNFIWNNRERQQSFQFGPADNQKITTFIAKDSNAHIGIISGAWAVPLFKKGGAFSETRAEAAHLQRIENMLLKKLQRPETKAIVTIYQLAEFVENYDELCATLLENTIGPSKVIPKLDDLRGFGQFLQSLKNNGMHPYLAGEFRVEQPKKTKPIRKPYLVREK